MVYSLGFGHSQNIFGNPSYSLERKKEMEKMLSFQTHKIQSTTIYDLI